MSQLILLGNPGTKRTIYLEKAARKAEITIHLLDWKDFREKFRKQEGDCKNSDNYGSFKREEFWKEKIFLKIDPPLWESCCLEELNTLAYGYQKELWQIKRLGEQWDISFLNQPEDIISLLDKRGCKRCLSEAGIPVTEEITGVEEKEISLEKESLAGYVCKPEEDSQLNRTSLAYQLLEIMSCRKVFQVFIKPVQGSGAAGVAAFRYQPKTGQMVLYTCGIVDDSTGHLVNTKRLRRFSDRRQVISIVEKLLRLNCVVERWYAKAEHKGFSYDLRAVVQDGQVDFVLARLSSGPITNLHLNNHPLRWQELGLTPKTMDSVFNLCSQAAKCYPGLRSIGIDILLEKGSLRPRIIEMNGQGDLIYQDIYDNNRIYRHQAEMMKEWLWKTCR